MWRTGLCTGLAVMGALAGGGPETRASEPIVEKLEHGQVNWTERVVLATGSGVPDDRLSNVAQVRLEAERAAKGDAYRKIFETLRRVRVTASTSGDGSLRRPEVSKQVQGIIRRCRTVDTRYYSDGGVDVVVRCPLDGGLASALVPIESRRALSTKGDAEYSGLIVDAVGTKVRPALSPRLVDPDGNVVYAAPVVGPNPFRQYGAARFSRTVEAARRDSRVGSRPLIVKAVGLGDTATDVQMSAEDSAKLSGGNLAFLLEARVVIVTDGP